MAGFGLRLSAAGLSRRFGDFHALHGVDVDLLPGQVHAILGENGAGKSTLMKLLYGLLQPSDGSLFLNGDSITFSSPAAARRAGVGLLEQHFSLVDNLTALENVALTDAEFRGRGWWLDRAELIKRIEAVLPGDELKLPWHQRVRDLPVGQRQRLEIVKLLFGKAKVLLLDEPTAVLTPQEVEPFLAFLKQLAEKGHTIALITHKLAEVRKVAHSFTVLRGGRKAGAGELSTVSDAQLVEMMVGHSRSEPALRSLPRATELREPVVSARGLRAPGTRLESVDLQLHAGEVVGVAGVDGSGQQELVLALTGQLAHEGELLVLGRSPFAKTAELRRNGLAFVPEDRHLEGLWMQESTEQNLALGHEDRYAPRGLINRSLRRELATLAGPQLDVRAPSLDTAVEKLSGGNQQKVVIARETVGRNVRLLIAHQPTRGVDIGATDLIHRAILQNVDQRGMAALILSSELDELMALCDRIVVLHQGRSVKIFDRGHFDRLAIGAAMAGGRPA